MKAFALQIASGLLVAALVGNVAFLWSANARLASLEVKVELLTASKHFASNENQP
jgi:hypothetical protein